MYALSVLFVVVKNVFWALPEFTTLAADDTYEFINVLRLFAAVIIIPVAIVWLVRIIKYFRAINKDADFVESLKTVYLEKIQNARDFFISRVVSIGLAIMTGAFILSLDFTVDSVNAISDIWLYIAAIVSALFLRRHTEKWKLLIIPSTLGIAAAVFCDLATNHFFSRHSPNDVIRNIEAYNSYYFMLFMYVAEAVIFIGLLLCAIPAIRDLFVSYTDMSGNIGSSDYKAMKRKFNCGSATVLSLGVIAALSGLYYVYSIPRTYKGLVFELSGIISHTLCIVFVFVTWYFIGYVKSAIKQHCKSSLY